jgi:hypothetical protein
VDTDVHKPGDVELHCRDAGCFVRANLSLRVRVLPLQTEWSLADGLQHGAGLIDRIMCCTAARMIRMGLEAINCQAEPTPEANVCFSPIGLRQEAPRGGRERHRRIRDVSHLPN